jgi:ATP-dependent DNA ligase
LHLRPQGEVEVALTRRDGLRNDRKIIESQLATLKMKAPSGPQWIHEIKYDGYRVQLRIDGDDRRA